MNQPHDEGRSAAVPGTGPPAPKSRSGGHGDHARVRYDREHQPRAHRQRPREITGQTAAALAGPDPDRAALIRASAALAAVKAAAMAAMDLGGGTLTAADRAEVLAAARRVLEESS